MAACGQNNGEKDVAKFLKRDANEEEDRSGKIKAIFGGSHFHDRGYIDTDKCTKFDNDPPHTIRKELEERIKETQKAGLYLSGAVKLKATLHESKEISNARFGRGGPAKVTPLKTDIKLGTKPIKVVVGRNITDQPTLFRNYIKPLTKFGFPIPNLDAAWNAPPSLVPKNAS